MLYDVAIFLISLAVIAKASHTALKSSINLSKHLGIGEFAVGFVLIAVMTSLPELIVSITSGLKGAGAIVLGNVLGSNITNSLLVVGAVAYLQGIKIKHHAFVNNAAFLFGISAIALVLLQLKTINTIEGILHIAIFVIYSLMVLRTKISLDIKEPIPRNLNITQALFSAIDGAIEAMDDLFLLGVGVGLIIIASNFFVDSAVNIASAIGISQAAIGITIVALGTSMPELAIAAQAIRSGHKAIALGETIGSSIVNLTLVLGAGAIFTRIPIDFLVVGPAVITMVLISLVLWYLMSTRKKIGRSVGIAFLGAYALFLLMELGIVAFA